MGTRIDEPARRGVDLTAPAVHRAGIDLRRGHAAECAYRAFVLRLR